MTHLAQPLFEATENLLYRAASPGLAWRAELCSSQFVSRESAVQFQYAGVPGGASGDTQGERIVGSALQLAKRYSFESSTFLLAEALSGVHVLSRTETGKFVGVGLMPSQPLNFDSVLAGVVLNLNAEKPRRAQAAPTHAELPLWVRQVNRMRTHEVGEVANSIKSVMREFAESGAYAVDASIARVDFGAANDFHLVAVLRALRPHREQLKSWRHAVEKTRQLLAKKELPVDRILRGLD
jgi:hypothetical protein